MPRSCTAGSRSCALTTSMPRQFHSCTFDRPQPVLVEAGDDQPAALAGELAGQVQRPLARRSTSSTPLAERPAGQVGDLVDDPLVVVHDDRLGGAERPREVQRGRLAGHRDHAAAGLRGECHEQRAEEADAHDGHGLPGPRGRCARAALKAQPSASPGNGWPSSSGGSGTSRSHRHDELLGEGAARPAAPRRCRRRRADLDDPPPRLVPGQRPAAAGSRTTAAPPTPGGSSRTPRSPRPRPGRCPGTSGADGTVDELDRPGRGEHGAARHQLARDAAGAAAPSQACSRCTPSAGDGARRPAGGLAEAAGVGDVVALVAHPPVAEAHLGRGPPRRADEVEQLEQADGALRPAAHVERLAGEGVDVVQRQLHRVEQVLDVQHVAHLAAVAVDRDRLRRRGACMRKCATQPWSSLPHWCGP